MSTSEFSRVLDFLARIFSLVVPPLESETSTAPGRCAIEQSGFLGLLYCIAPPDKGAFFCVCPFLEVVSNMLSSAVPAATECGG